MTSNQDPSFDNQDLSTSSQSSPSNNSAPSSQSSPSNNSAKSQSQGLSNWILGGGLAALIVALATLIAAVAQIDQQTRFSQWMRSWVTHTNNLPIVEKPPDLKKIFPYPSSDNPDVLQSDGSNSMVEMMRDIQQEIKTPESLNISLSFGAKNLKPQGSQKGIELLKAKRIHLAAFSGIIPNDIAVISEGKLPEDIEQKALIAIPIAKDAIAVLVNKNNPVKSLTKVQLKQIYTCKVTNWGFVGGKENAGIKVVNRHSSSGTRESFKSLVLPNEDFCPGIKPHEKNGSSFETWNEDETTEVLRNLGANGIYYASTSQVRYKEVKALAIGEREPTATNIFEDRYPLERNLYLVTRKDASEDRTS